MKLTVKERRRVENYTNKWVAARAVGVLSPEERADFVQILEKFLKE